MTAETLREKRFSASIILKDTHTRAQFSIICEPHFSPAEDTVPVRHEDGGERHKYP